MNILYATDGSEGSHGAAHFLSSLEHRDEVRVHVLTVPASNLEEDQQAAADALAYASVTLGAFPGCVTTEITLPANTNGAIAERIVERAFTLRADLVVVGTHGRSTLARWFIGSVALNVVRHAPCPVLIARAPHGATDRILVGVDGSSCAENAAQWGLSNLSLPRACTLHFLGIVTLPSIAGGDPMLSSLLAEDASLLIQQEQDRLTHALTRLTNAMQNPSRTITSDTLVGNAAGSLIETAKEWEADLLIVGSHGLSGVERWVLGSVSEGVIQRTPCSVLVVREPQTQGIAITT